MQIWWQLNASQCSFQGEEREILAHKKYCVYILQLFPARTCLCRISRESSSPDACPLPIGADFMTSGSVAPGKPCPMHQDRVLIATPLRQQRPRAPIKLGTCKKSRMYMVDEGQSHLWITTHMHYALIGRTTPIVVICARTKSRSQVWMFGWSW